MFKFLSTLPAWEEISKLFFQMSAQVYTVPDQTEGKSKTFLEWKTRDLSHELYLACGSNINYYKSVHQSTLTRENREHHGKFQSKSVLLSTEFYHFTF